MALPPVTLISALYLQMLNGMLADALRWMRSANGDNKAVNNPISRMMAKDLAVKALEQYFRAIEDVIPKEKTENKDKPKESA